MSRPRLIALLLALLTLVLFLPATRFSFINYDDNDYITANPPVQAGLSLAGVKWAFTTMHASNWHPLTWISHMADCSLFGLNPGGHHLVNVLFQCANTVLLFALLLRLTNALWPAAFVAALFAWHPLHIESVAWIAERKDVLSTFFALLTLLCYTRFVQEKNRRDLWLALLFFAFGLLSKPMLVTLPCVLLLLDLWPLQRLPRGTWRVADVWPLVREKIPFFALVVAACLLTIMAQSQSVRGDTAVVSLEIVPLHYRLKNVPVAYTEYLLKLAWPAKLSAFYPLADRIPAARAATAVATLLLISVVAFWRRRSQPYLVVGWLWFLGMLVPVIGLVQVGGAAMADRYSYLPGVGIFIMVAYAARDLAGKFSATKNLLAVAAVLVLGGCLWATDKQLPVWQNSEMLFRHALAVTSKNDIAHNDLAIALEEKGDLTGAATEYRAAIKIAPERHLLHNNLGNILGQLGQHTEALAEYREAIRLQPADALLHVAAGHELASLGRFEEALKEFAGAERLDPSHARTHLERADVFFQQGRDVVAVNELRAALRLTPDDWKILAETAHRLAASENPETRDGKMALALALKANVLSQQSQPMVFDVLGMALAETGDFTNAVTCAQNAYGLAKVAKMKSLEPITQRRELYLKHQPWRESFRNTNAPAAGN